MRKFVFLSVFFIAVVTVIVCAINIYIIETTSQNFLKTNEDISNEKYDCILVLGAGLRSDGTPSDMLSDRLSAAISLYKMGLSDTILLSGDRSGDDYDEVSSMRQYCINNGIPQDSIMCDDKGFSTFETMYNVKSIGGIERILVVTQGYHLHRALYIAKRMGLEPSGVSSDPREYRGQFIRDIREGFARVKDFFMILNYNY